MQTGTVIEGSGETGRIIRKARIALVDDHPLMRLGLREMLSREEDLEVVADYGNGLDLLELAARGGVDLAIIDLLMPSTTGATLVTALQRAQPRCRILVLSMVEEPIRIAELMRAGAHGFALKSAPPPRLIGAVRAVLAGQRYLPESIPSEQLSALIDSDDAWPLRRLTCREREIFDLLVSGRTNDDIATQLRIARRTVETHRQHIMKKVGARSLVELIRLGMKHGVATTVTAPAWT